ncbi:MAG: calcium/sodium antiporter [Bacteroidota bacterium]
MDILSLIKDFALLIVSFGTIHFISKKYFIVSLDYISKKLRLSSDMAGSTLMAAGSSAPELAVALFAIFLSGHHEAIGVGTIVGSALFNILAITGVVMWYKRTSKLVWQPIFRDIIFYILAVIFLAYIFYTGKLTLAGSILLVGLYVFYVVVVYYGKHFFQYEDAERNADNDEVPDRLHNGLSRYLQPFDQYIARFQFLVFIISIGLISFLSWMLVESAIGISAVLGIPELLVGITIVAIGTSVPDLISSVIVAKQGRHGMAINNAIGSNTFDILIGLGLPFLLYMLIHGSGFELASENLLFSVGVLLASAIVLLLFFLIGKWRISRVTGIILVLLYAVYLAYVIVQSL